MNQVPHFRALGLAVITSALLSQVLAAQAGDPKDLLLKKLNGQFVPTKFTADKSGIVTPGVIVALKKDGLLIYTVAVPAAPISVYKEGKLSQGFGDRLKVDMVDGMNFPGGASSIPRKMLVAGEKVWVKALEFDKDAILVQVVTDPYDDGRYFGTLKFLVPKGTLPSPDDAVRAISEVLEPQPPQDQPAQPAPVPPPPPPAPAQFADIAPPPPPPGPTPTISVGQTKDQVIAAFGEPVRKAVIGPKEIFVYKDMKVTFTSGKVSNVE